MFKKISVKVKIPEIVTKDNYRGVQRDQVVFKDKQNWCSIFKKLEIPNPKLKGKGNIVGIFFKR